MLLRSQRNREPSSRERYIKDPAVAKHFARHCTIHHGLLGLQQTGERGERKERKDKGPRKDYSFYLFDIISLAIEWIGSSLAVFNFSKRPTCPVDSARTNHSQAADDHRVSKIFKGTNRGI
jgi:hypothetical protein